MKRRSRRALSLALTLCMILGFFPAGIGVTARADEIGVTATADSAAYAWAEDSAAFAVTAEDSAAFAVTAEDSAPPLVAQALS